MSRKQLPDQTVIFDAGGTTYTITRLFAKGGSALVYEGIESNTKGNFYVLVKEVYPDFGPILKRDDNNTIFSNIKTVQEQYNNQITRVINETDHYNKLASGKNEARNDAYFNRSFHIKPEHSTTHNCYVILDTVKGNTLDQYLRNRACKFTECCTLMQGLLKSIKVLHNALAQMKKPNEASYATGHLDISPDNIYISDDIETVRLIDFNSSAYSLSGEELNLPSKYAYSAPEIYSNDPATITYRADLYSASVVFFKMLTGHTEFERGNIHTQLKGAALCKNTNPGAIRLAAELIEKGLNYEPDERWQSADEMYEIVKEIYRLSQIKVFLRDNCSHIEMPQYCYMREDVLESIHDRLTSDRHIFVSGIGGSGKSTLSVLYALEYGHLYDSIQFVTYSTSLKDLVTALSFNGISEEDFKDSDGKLDTERMNAAVLNALTAPENAKNLIIIENYNILPDEQYAEFMSNINCCVIFNTRCYKESDSTYLKLNNLEEEDAYAFFQSICQRPDEEKEIWQIINRTGRNFLLMKMIALLLKRLGRLKTTDVLEKLQLSEPLEKGRISVDILENGINAYEETTIEAHLVKVFDLSELSDELCEILSAMTIIPYSGINKNKFEEILQLDVYDERIEYLIELGWITKNGDTICLHQTISDLLYRVERTKPNWQNALIEANINDLVHTINQKSDILIAQESDLDFYASRINGASESCFEFYKAVSKVYEGKYLYEKSLGFLKRIEENNHLTQKQKKIYDICMGDFYIRYGDYYSKIYRLCMNMIFYLVDKKTNNNEPISNSLFSYININDIVFSQRELQQYIRRNGGAVLVEKHLIDINRISNMIITHPYASTEDIRKDKAETERLCREESYIFHHIRLHSDFFVYAINFPGGFLINSIDCYMTSEKYYMQANATVTDLYHHIIDLSLHYYAIIEKADTICQIRDYCGLYTQSAKKTCEALYHAYYKLNNTDKANFYKILAEGIKYSEWGGG